MLLPCPHCKRRFKLSPERIPAGAAKLKCPACKGYFVVDTSPLRWVPNSVSEPATAHPPRISTAEDQPTEGSREIPPKMVPPGAAGSTEPGKRRRVNRSTWTALLLLLPAFALLVALVGVMVPVVWKIPSVAVQKGEPSASCTLPSPAAVRTSNEAEEGKVALESKIKEQRLAQASKAPTYRSMWPFSPVEKGQGCAYLAQLQGKQPEKKASDPCSLYSPWIAYLILESSSKPVCNLEAVFGTATEAIRKRKLCGCGYAFLTAYYSYKKVLDRSRSFLEQALQLSPDDPWVRLVEAVVHERDFRDSEKAIRMLNSLLREKGSFSLAQYQLAKLYIAKEKYGKAHDLFLLLEQAFPEQPGFMRVQKSLASIEDVPYYSADMARGLLKVSRALSDLMDYPLAGQIYRKVLEEMPGTLARAEQKSALYDLGRISEITGDTETAYNCYQKALRIDPFYRDARERMGSILKGNAQTS